EHRRELDPEDRQDEEQEEQLHDERRAAEELDDDAGDPAHEHLARPAHEPERDRDDEGQEGAAERERHGDTETLKYARPRPPERFEILDHEFANSSPETGPGQPRSPAQSCSVVSVAGGRFSAVKPNSSTRARYDDSLPVMLASSALYAS